MSGDRTLISGGTVLSLAPGEDAREADLLVADGRIEAIGTGLDAPAGAELIDAGGMIVMPGFVDTHRHTWQTAMRGICADWTLLDYFRGIRLHLSTMLGPEDVYAGNYAGALEAIDAGVTTILDFSHCNNSPEHADEAIRGLRDAGVRGTFAYGFYPVPLAEPHFGDHGERIADAHRVRSEHFAADRGDLLGMGVALTELGLVPFEQTRHEVEAARELDLLLTAHVGTVTDRRWPREVELLHEAGLLGPGQVHVHCNACSDAELGLIAAAGASVSVTPETELQMGMGWPVTGRAMAQGLRPGFGCDIVSNNSGDLLTQARIALQTQRALDNDAELREQRQPAELSLSAREALELATIGGAEALGLGSEIGTLEVGKRADLLLVDSDRIGLTPRPDPVAAVILQASPRDIDTVIVDGTVRKRGGRLQAAELRQARLLGEASRARIFAAAEQRGGLLLDLPDGWFDVTRDAVLANIAG